MAYCPKCGVEVHDNIKECPLCKFPIPDVKQAEDEVEPRFPSMKNEYIKRDKKTKNIIFAVLSILIFSSALLLGYNNMKFHGKLTWSKYSIVSLIATWFYLFFLFGYIKKFVNKISGVSITTIFLLYYIDSFNGKIEWFYWIGLASVLGAYFLLLISYYILKVSKKNGINVTAFGLIIISIYCIILDLSINEYFYNEFIFSWSINVAGELTPLAIVLFIISGTIGNKIILSMKKKFHL